MEQTGRPGGTTGAGHGEGAKGGWLWGAVLPAGAVPALCWCWGCWMGLPRCRGDGSDDRREHSDPDGHSTTRRNRDAAAQEEELVKFFED